MNTCLSLRCLMVHHDSFDQVRLLIERHLADHLYRLLTHQSLWSPGQLAVLLLIKHLLVLHLFELVVLGRLTDHIFVSIAGGLGVFEARLFLIGCLFTIVQLDVGPAFSMV